VTPSWQGLLASGRRNFGAHRVRHGSDRVGSVTYVGLRAALVGVGVRHSRRHGARAISICEVPVTPAVIADMDVLVAVVPETLPKPLRHRERMVLEGAVGVVFAQVRAAARTPKVVYIRSRPVRTTRPNALSADSRQTRAVPVLARSVGCSVVRRGA
jgi:hypothetical protein